jgi:hypothetical protein
MVLIVQMQLKFHNYENCKICTEITDSDHGYTDDPDSAAVQTYRQVPDCTDCEAMANLTNTHLAEIKVEE